MKRPTRDRKSCFTRTNPVPTPAPADDTRTAGKRRRWRPWIGSKLRDGLPDLVHQLRDEPESLGLLLKHIPERTFFQGGDIEIAAPVRRNRAGQNIEEPVYRVEPAPQIVILADRPAEKTAKAAKQSSKQNVLAIVKRDGGCIVKPHAVYQNNLHR